MKRFIALFLALTMILSLCPVTALAEELPAEADISVEENIVDSSEEEIVEETDLQEPSLVQIEMASYSISEEDLGYTDDEAFAAYVQREFDEALGIEAPAMWSTSVLEDGTYGAIIYEKLKPMLSATANGEVETTEFEVSLDSNIETTEGELQFFYDDIFLALTCLLADCPLELYWFDKTTSFYYQPICYLSGSTLLITGAKVSLPVSADYSFSGETGTYDVDTEKTGATQAAVENAVAIVEEHASKGNYAKLEAYRDEICGLVAYNTAAAGNSPPPYGDPWQMIWVFDGDASTKVVCEGYSKAFQYLCDMSTFSTNGVDATPVECHTVYGDVDFGGGDGGPHMWNVVTMDDGNNYLVDVTNCDMGSYGDDSLFIVPTDDDYWYTTIKYSDGTEDECLSYSTAIGYNYIYSPEIETLFGDACYLSQTAYEAPTEPAVEAQWGIAKSDGTAPDEWVDSGTMEQARKYANKLESGSTAYIRLLSDIEVAGGLHFASGKETILDLNGKTIDRGLTAAIDNGSVIFISGDLTICDTSTNKNGMLTGAYTNGAGAIVLNDGSAFTLTSGNISGNNAPGVTVWGTSEFNMTGGTISGNAAPYSGGGVVVEGTFNMSGGTISGNTANEGGGVYSYGTMRVSGAPKISENVKNGTLNETTGLYELGRNGSVNNVYLQSGSAIAVTDKLNDGATIGVANKLSSDVASVTVAIGSNYALNDTDAAKFVSDAGYTLKLDSTNNNILLKENTTPLPTFTYDGDEVLGAYGVLTFTGLGSKNKLICDSGSIAQWHNLDGHFYTSYICGDVDSRTVYLGLHEEETLSVSGGLTPEKVGSWVAPWDLTYSIYKLTVQNPGDSDTVEYTVTRSFLQWNETLGEEEKSKTSVVV